VQLQPVEFDNAVSVAVPLVDPYVGLRTAGKPDQTRGPGLGPRRPFPVRLHPRPVSDVAAQQTSEP
jgi:hypothetical protein